MGFLHKLWDETVAGPAPENGLAKLRNHISGQNITINTNQKLMVNPSRVPDSPVGSSIPGSPVTRKLPFLLFCLILVTSYDICVVYSHKLIYSFYSPNHLYAAGTPSETHATSLNACDWFCNIPSCDI